MAFGYKTLIANFRCNNGGRKVHGSGDSIERRRPDGSPCRPEAGATSLDIWAVVETRHAASLEFLHFSCNGGPKPSPAGGALEFLHFLHYFGSGGAHFSGLARRAD